MAHLTQERLKALLRYNPETGDFIWMRRDPSEWSEKEKGRAWNTRYAGKVAGFHSHGYIRVSIDDRKHYAHRLAWLFMTGEFPSAVIDHIDHDGTNNKWSNLRDVGKRENAINVRKPRRNKTGYTGVVLLPSGRFMAQKKIEGDQRYLGTYATAEEAHAVYLSAR